MIKLCKEWNNDGKNVIPYDIYNFNCFMNQFS